MAEIFEGKPPLETKTTPEVKASPENVKAILDWLESKTNWSSGKPLSEYAEDAPEGITEPDLQELFLSLKPLGVAGADHDIRSYYVTALAHRILEERTQQWHKEHPDASDAELHNFFNDEGNIELTHPETGKYSWDRFKNIGHGWEKGTLTLKGDFGNSVGGGMKGGKIQVEGNTGPRAGSLMTGGELEISGKTGYELGFGMRGGQIRAGISAPSPGRRMHDGTIEINKVDLSLPGSNNVRQDDPWIGAEKTGGRVIVAGKEY